MTSSNDDADFIDYSRTTKETAETQVRARSAVPVPAHVANADERHANLEHAARTRIPGIDIPSGGDPNAYLTSFQVLIVACTRVLRCVQATYRHSTDATAV
jgi:hypothetical protein